jgi:hypothetical protein
MCVRIDLERLRLRLSAEQGRVLSDADVRVWLRDRGFHVEGEAWACDGPEMRGMLRDDEVTETITTLTENGVTYINTVKNRPC